MIVNVVHFSDCSPEVIHLLLRVYWSCWPEAELGVRISGGQLAHEGSPVAVLVLGRSRRRGTHRLVWRGCKSGIGGGIDEGLCVVVLVEREVVRRWRYRAA